jgi:hypothetical protein
MLSSLTKGSKDREENAAHWVWKKMASLSVSCKVMAPDVAWYDAQDVQQRQK